MLRVGDKTTKCVADEISCRSFGRSLPFGHKCDCKQQWGASSSSALWRDVGFWVLIELQGVQTILSWFPVGLALLCTQLRISSSLQAFLGPPGHIIAFINSGHEVKLHIISFMYFDPFRFWGMVVWDLNFQETPCTHNMCFTAHISGWHVVPSRG